MNSNNTFGLLMIAVIILVALALQIALWKSDGLTERASSFTHYSDSTWQVNDTVYWRHGADTIKLDVTKQK